MDYCTLSDTGALAARGPDAVTFLQGQLTQDVRRVAERGALRAAYNTPQGRVIALARLHALDDGVLLQLPRALVPGVLARLQRFVLRSKVKLQDVSDDWGYAGLVAPAPADLDALGIGAAEPGAARALGDGVSAVRLDERWLLHGPAPALARRLAGGRARGAADWQRAAILAGDPTVEPSASEAWVAQMLNLDLLDGVSFTKGCYTGQEIVARTQHLGRIKRRTFRYRIAAERPLAPLDPLLLDETKVGEVVVAHAAGGTTELLAVVALEARDRPLRTATGDECLPQPLPYAIE